MAANGTAKGLSRAISATASGQAETLGKIILEAMLQSGDLDRAGKPRQSTREQHGDNHQPFGSQAGVKRRARTGADNVDFEAEGRPGKHEGHRQCGYGGNDDAGVQARTIDQNGQLAIARNGK